MTNSIFQIIEPDLNGDDHNDKITDLKYSVIAKTSRYAYEYFEERFSKSKLLEACNELSIKYDERKAFFHIGFQYGYSAAETVSDKAQSLLDGLESKLNSQNQNLEFTDELVANITIDRENGFLQLTVGGKTITCKNTQTVDIIEL